MTTKNKEFSEKENLGVRTQDYLEVPMLTRPALHFEMSSSIAKLALAQTKVQKEIKDLPKESKGFAHKYTTFDKLVQYLRPILSKHGLSFIQMPCGDNENVGVITIYMHTSGEYISSKIETQIIQAQNKYQSMGSAITYFKRYSLASFVGVASEEDTDGNIKKPKPKPKLTPLTKSQRAKLLIALEEAEAPDDAHIAMVQAVDARKINQENFDEVLKGVTEKGKPK